MSQPSLATAPRLVLFDIDGTLVLGNRRLRGWFGEALIEVFGRAGDIDGHSFAGKIDPQIVTELLTDAGVPRERIEVGIPRVQTAYVDRLRRGLSCADLRLLPHVREVLDRLQARGDLALGLLTGNWEQVARVKLECFDLNRYFPFGAFSDGQRRRSDLPPIALDRARQTLGQAVSSSEVLIVGDSPLDIDCAHRNGIRAVAVATGYTDRVALEQAGADWALDDLGQIHEVHKVFGS